jgi:hypothetical protein
VLLQKAEKEVLPAAFTDFAQIGFFAVSHRYDDIPELQVLDRTSALATVRLIREHVVARIAALSASALSPPV